jgi:hypothetical protein
VADFSKCEILGLISSTKNNNSDYDSSQATRLKMCKRLEQTLPKRKCTNVYTHDTLLDVISLRQLE